MQMKTHYTAYIMKYLTRYKIIFAIISTIFTCIILLLTVLILLITEIRTAQLQPLSIPSPSGKRVLNTSINLSKEDMSKYFCVKLTIRDIATSRILFEVQTGASTRMQWSVHWLRENLILLRSSDIGNYCWVETLDGAWNEVDCPEIAPQKGI